jgi:hypothetical protein
MKTIIKRVLFLKILLFFNTTLFAPASPSIPILIESPVDPFRHLIYAIGMVETGLDTIAYNPLEEAIGYFQIRPVRLEDYNRRTGNRYAMKDLYNYSISEKIFKYYAAQIGPYDFETIAKSWNGSGIMTIDYWNRVKMHL